MIQRKPWLLFDIAVLCRQVLSVADVESLFEAARRQQGEAGLRLRCLLDLLYGSGLRVSELGALQA